MTTKQDGTFMIWQTNEPEKSFDIEQEIIWALQRFETKYGKPTEVRHKSGALPVEISNKFPGVEFATDAQIYHQGILWVFGEMRESDIE